MKTIKESLVKGLENIPFLRKILKGYRQVHFYIVAARDPRKNANAVYKSVFHEDINWEQPSDLLEKIYYLQLFTDTSLWTKCADKYRMREYVESKGCSDILPNLYGHWTRAEDLNFDKLPNQFVLKTTNGCGQVIVVKDKAKLNIAETRLLLNEWLKMKYGFTDAQVHYSRIEPCIIAERYLSSKNQDSDTSLIDYKVWCFHGKPEYILVVYNRVILGSNQGYKLSAYDLEWNNISDKVLAHNNKHYDGTSVLRPQKLAEMLSYAEKLSKDFIEVRIDFYETDGIIHLGEMTFTTGYGYHTKEYYEYLGSKIDLSKANRIVGINRPPKL